MSNYIKILNKKPAGKERVVISNIHSNVPDWTIGDFCRKQVVEQLLGILEKQNSGHVYFKKGETSYRLYGGPNRTKTIPGDHCFHVYKFVD